MKLDEGGSALGVDQLERVRAVAVHVSEAIGRAAVREEERDLVTRLRSQCDKVPEHVRVLQMRHWIALLCVNEAGKL